MKKVLILLFSVGFVFSSLQSQGLFETHPNSILRNGNLDYKKGKYSDAIKKYNTVFRNQQNDPLLNYNLGTFLYRNGDYDTSAHFFNNAIKYINNNQLKSKAYYNLGNAYMQKKEYDKAIQSYVDALKYNPNDPDSRYNLSYALRNMKKQQQQQQKPKDNEGDDGDEDGNPESNDDSMNKDKAKEILNSLNNKEQNQNKNVKTKGNNIKSKDW